MQQDILIIGVLFPAIPLMMVISARYAILATLIRHLHDEVIRDNVSPNDAERFPFRSTGFATAAPYRDYPVLRGDLLRPCTRRDDCRLFR